MPGQNPLANNNQELNNAQLFNVLAQAQQQATEKANMCERFLGSYREYVGPVHDVQELQSAGQSPDLLSMRFAILKSVRDDAATKANVLANQMIASAVACYPIALVRMTNPTISPVYPKKNDSTAAWQKNDQIVSTATEIYSGAEILRRLVGSTSYAVAMFHGRKSIIIWSSVVTVITLILLASRLTNVSKSSSDDFQGLEAELMMKILAGIAVQSRAVNNNAAKEEFNLTLTPANGSLSPCGLFPERLNGPYRVDRTPYDWSHIEEKFSWLENGGHATPENCLAQHRVAIIVPYRNREEHLKLFINNLHEILRAQELDYALIVVEQIQNQHFNRAKLMNVGYVEAQKVYPWECFVFHDVDLIPEDDRNLYYCPVTPRHMSVAIDVFNYQLLHEGIFGGVVAFTNEQMRGINGFPNDYWGWGGEDDDLIVRVKAAGYNYTRYPDTVARYTMHKHKHASDAGNGENECRWRLLEDAHNRWQSNGLNNLKYNVENMTFNKLYTHILVDLLEEESKADIPARVNCTQ